MSYDGTLKFDTKIDIKGFQTGISKVSAFAKAGMGAAAKAVGAGAAAIAGLGTASVNVGMTFEKSMSNVAAISGATGKDLEQLTAKAKEMGAKTKFSASESADAFSYMAMAGWKTKDMLGGIDGIMNLAAASGEDLAQTSDIVTDALTAFGMRASDAGHFADILAAASSNSNTNVGMMGETFKYVAPVAGALGYTAEDTAHAIGLMANAGIKSSQAGTALRALFTRLAKPTKQMQGAIEALGISLTDSAGNVKPLNQLLTEMRGTFAGLTDAEKTQYAATLAGQEGMSGLLAIMNASDKDWNKLKGSIDNCTDATTGYSAAAEMAEVMQNNLAGQMDELSSAAEGLGIEIYRSVDAPLKDVAKSATDMVNELSKAVTDGGIAALPEAVGTALSQVLAGLADKAPEFIQMGVDMIHSFCEGLKNADEIGKSSAELVATIANGILAMAGDLATTGIKLLAELMKGLVGSSEEIGENTAELLVRIADSIQTNLPIIVESGKKIVQGFFRGMSEEFPGVSALLSGFFEGFTGTMESAITGIADVLSKLFEAINGADPATMQAIGEGLGRIAAAMVLIKGAGAVTGTFSKVTSGASAAATGVKNAAEAFKLYKGGAGTLVESLELVSPKLAAMASGFQTVGKFIAGNIAKIGGIGLVITGAVTAVTSFVDMFKNGFSAVKEAIMLVGIAMATVGAIILGVAAFPAVVVGAIVAAVATAVILIKDHWTQIVEWFKTAWTTVVAFFTGLPEKLGTFFVTVGEKIATFFTELPGKLVAFFTTIGTTVGTFLSSLPYKIGYALGVVIGNVIKFGISLITWVTQTVPQIIGNIVNFFMTLPGRIWTCLVSAIQKIQQWGAQTLAKARQFASNTIQAVISFFSQLPGRLWSFLTNTISKVATFGSDLVAKGREAASNFLNTVVDTASELPGKMLDIGQNIVEGVWNGIQGMAGWFMDSVTGFFDGIVDGVMDTLGIHSPSRVFDKKVGRWIPPGVGRGVKESMPELEREINAEMAGLAGKMQTAVASETGRVSYQKTGKLDYDAALADRRSQSNVHVTGTIDEHRPLEVHTHLHMNKKQLAHEITPAVNNEMYKIDKADNGRGRGIE